jgi:hypothetical protein
MGADLDIIMGVRLLLLKLMGIYALSLGFLIRHSLLRIGIGVVLRVAHDGL